MKPEKHLLHVIFDFPGPGRRFISLNMLSTAGKEIQ